MPEKTWICERKAVQDLGASIKSGRLAEQVARAAATEHRIVIIVEGNIREGSLPQKSLWGATIHAAMRKNL